MQQISDFCRGFRSIGIGLLLLFRVCPAESDAFESPKSEPRPHAVLPCLYVRSGSPRQGRNHAAQPSQGRTLHRIGPRIRLRRRRLECRQFTLLQFVRNQNGTPPHGGPKDSVPGGRLVAPPFSSFQMHGEIVHRRRGIDRTGRASVAAEEDTRRPVVGNHLR